MPRLYWNPEISDGLVMEDAGGALWVVARPLTSDSLRPFQGDRSQLEPIAAMGQEVPGQLGVDLVGITEIADRAHVSRDTVQKWRERHEEFPGPIATLAAGPVWSWEAVDRWLRVRRPPGRPSADTLADRAWAAVEIALPAGWEAAFVATEDHDGFVAEASHERTRMRLRGSGDTPANALFDLATALRQAAAGQPTLGTSRPHSNRPPRSGG